MIKKLSFLFKYLKNPYILTVIIFLAWIFILDNNNVIVQLKLYNTNYRLEESIEYYEDQIQILDSSLKEINKKEVIEKIAREQYFMKKKDEDIFIVE